jgi:two-component system chemotaxis response regulator CheB
VGILLSGANEDGARGMRAIHAAGGLTIAQAPDSASVPTMPQAAIAALAADFVLPPQDIAALLNDLHRRDQL